ncbi:hypothetical protein FLK61_31130 [Paenalkalicoccus suaedae]|uniref:Uncharacterized protein n=1 Tax=Paenalkalicoccus suaedae TaxID=2592382 RepID=A0A859FE92_9BACI|nr:hypothetical protein [Paenalkalicoccus suaedae]QKS71168.1 hypothetical protein FLK61_31130 [Paenalkalicoccus suaedae]
MPTTSHLYLTIYSYFLSLVGVGYALYYFYIGVVFGFNDRLLLQIITNGPMMLLLAVGLLLLFSFRVGWWLHMIVFTQLLLAKVVSLIGEVILSQTGLFYEDLSVSAVFLDISVVLLYIVALLVFTSDSVKQLIHVKTETLRIHPYWIIIIFAIMLYAIEISLSLYLIA